MFFIGEKDEQKNKNIHEFQAIYQSFEYRVSSCSRQELVPENRNSQVNIGEEIYFDIKKRSNS